MGRGGTLEQLSEVGAVQNVGALTAAVRRQRRPVSLDVDVFEVQSSVLVTLGRHRHHATRRRHHQHVQQQVRQQEVTCVHVVNHLPQAFI